jgi:tetratricopeptide (TPR) repeat protein
MLLAAIVLTARLAAAQTYDEKTERARAHLKSAIAYYDDGRYEDAAREMNAAYELKPVPDLQYNLAQCYERLGRLTDAADAYNAYLSGRPDAPDRKNIAARIENLRARAAAAKAGAPAPPPVEKEKVVFKTIVVYREAPPPPGRAARWAAWGLGVLALGGIATGIAFAVLAANDADAVSKGGNVAVPPVFDTKTQDAGKTDVIVSGVSFGVGALAAAGAVALYLVGNKIDREAPKLTLAPAGSGFVLAGRF